MPLESFYPVLLVEGVTASARFYTEYMGFGKVFESDWYVSLKHRENPAYELAIISPDHERGVTASGGSVGSATPTNKSPKTRLTVPAATVSARRAYGYRKISGSASQYPTPAYPASSWRPQEKP